MKRILAVLMALTVTVAVAQQSLVSPSPDGAEVYFISPADGDEVSSPVAVRFGLKGMGVAPAGVDSPDTGHHHLLIDFDGQLPIRQLPLPKTDQVVHYGGGQTETVLELAPGVHTLQLVLGNHLHVPHNPPVVSEQIVITVR